MTEDREALARRLAEERGLTLVPPYNDAAIIAGAGTPPANCWRMYLI